MSSLGQLLGRTLAALLNTGLRGTRLLLQQFLHGYLIDLHVLLNHHLFEALEVVHTQNLLHNPVVRRISRTRLASRLELLSRDSHFGDKLTEKFVHKSEKVLQYRHRIFVSNALYQNGWHILQIHTPI